MKKAHYFYLLRRGFFSGGGRGPVNTSAPVITSDSGNVNRETPPPTLTSTTGTWTGTGAITFAYQWQRNNVDISGATSSTYTLVADDDNANILCVITATDDEGSRIKRSNTLGPVLGIPTALVNPVASGTPEVDEVLTTTDGIWQGLPEITIAYQWRRDSVNISGATSNTYTLVSADLNALVDCQVTATNSIRSVSADTNDLGPIQAAPVIPVAPSISGAPTISGSAKVGETLTATAASATGEPTPTTSWQWERSDNGTTGWASISGATSSTYTAVSADESKYLRVVQTETNTEGSDSANSAATAQVAAAYDYLLDDYSGAAAAYSLRLLDSTYSGSAVRVRRASDNTEQDIGFVDNELDTSSLETFCSGTDGFVTTWYDQSGSNNATQTTAANQPKIVSSGTTITENSKPTIQWVDTSDILTATASISISNDLTAIAVNASNVQSSQFANGPILQYNVDSSNHISIGYRDGGYFTRLTKTGSTLTLNGYDFSSTSLNLVFDYVDYTNASNEIYVDNVSGSDANAGRSNFNGTSSIDIGNRTLGSLSPQTAISEMIFYESDQSTNRTGIQSNINDFYSIY